MVNVLENVDDTDVLRTARSTFLPLHPQDFKFDQSLDLGELQIPRKIMKIRGD